MHGVGGLVGTVCTGVFASARVARLDGAGGGGIAGGWLDRNWAQLGYQLAASVSGLAYSFVATAAILLVVGRVPGLRLRAAEEDEIAGIDDAEVGEFAYDYVELEREVGADGGVVEAVSVLSSRDGGGAGGFGDPLAGGEEKMRHHAALSRFV